MTISSVGSYIHSINRHVNPKRSLLLPCIVLCLPYLLFGQDSSVLTQHNDSGRTGANLTEAILSPNSIKNERFGKIFSLPVDGQIYAQPLVMANVAVQGEGVRNVVIVATMRNNIYAFDADKQEDAPLWKVNLGTPMLYDQIPVDVPGLIDQYNIRPFIGATSTPVIDPGRKRLYAVAKIAEPGQSIVNRLHAINITTGAIEQRVDIMIPKQGQDPNEVAREHLQRAALLLSKGKVYVAFGSHQDAAPLDYQGWLLAFDADTLELKQSFCLTPGGLQGSIWQSGNGPSADDDGNVYVMTANGSFNPDQRQFSDSFVKLSPDFSNVDWFTPSNVDKLNLLDIDLGSAGPVLLPSPLPQELVGGGKEGKFYLVNRTQLGHQQPHRFLREGINPPIQVVQAARKWRLTWLSWIPFLFYTGYHHIHGSPVIWISRTEGPLIYVWPEDDKLKAFKYDPNTKLNRKPKVSAQNDAQGMPGGILSVSANGQDNGLVWSAMPLEDDAFVQTVRGVLRVFDANTLEMLWSSDQYEPDDNFNFAKYVPPTIANGKVYLATFSDRLNVYGLNSPFVPPAAKPATKAPKNLHKRKDLHKRRTKVG